ncbi:hypothetical protein MHU86_7692 [Fragilaria crotonensis]|nr:hypothetical protein MHU86_7692 [Fragilaria crotonensis]
MASDSKDEPNAPRRRRDIRLELSQMGVDDEIVNKVLMKIRDRRAPAVCATLPPWNESYNATGLNDAALQFESSCVAVRQLHNHPLERWLQTDSTDNVKSMTKIESCSQKASDLSSPSGTRQRNENIDEDVETYRIEIQTDAAVPGEVNNDRLAEDSNGKQYIERYEMVPHMHRSVCSGRKRRLVAELGKDDATEAEQTQGTDETQLTFVPEHLKQVFVSRAFQRKDDATKGNLLRGSSQVTEKAFDEHEPVNFWPGCLNPMSMDACMPNIEWKSKDKQRNAGTRVPMEIVVVNKKATVSQYLSTRTEYAREVAKKKVDSKFVSGGKIKLGEVDPRRCNASTHQTSKHDCTHRHENQTFELFRGGRQYQDSNMIS